jgi:hypothetical protein
MAPPRGEIGRAGYLVHIRRKASLWLADCLVGCELTRGTRQNGRSKQCDER